MFFFFKFYFKGDITDLAVNFNNTLVASASNDYIIRVVICLISSQLICCISIYYL